MDAIGRSIIGGVRDRLRRYSDLLIESLSRAVATFGQQWEKVSSKVGRMSSDCRDRYRNHIVGRDVRNNGQYCNIFFLSRRSSTNLAVSYRPLDERGRG